MLHRNTRFDDRQSHASIHHWLTLLLIGAALCITSIRSSAQQGYTPQPVWCADGSNKLCAVIPSFIGPDPMLKPRLGYPGLSNDVTSADNDVQTPFDNMSWQMFVALNWQADKLKSDPQHGLTGTGATVWQTYSRPEDVFGGPVGSCPNPKNLPRFNIIAKSGAHGSRDEEFMQATGQPLIDVNGNWTLFERRLNNTEKTYIESNGLNTYAGQKAFAEAGKTVALPIGQMTPAGTVGAIEMKASWRILADKDKARYFHIQGLIDVQGAYVRDGKPLCQEATLGLVGLHIIQNNGKEGNLLPQFIWASFEHDDNAPLAQAACDPTNPNCYKTIANNSCPAASSDTKAYSFHNAACTTAATNSPPVLLPKEKAFIWERSPPYAKAYMTQTATKTGTVSCGTQVARCWQIYKLTGQLNKSWKAQLQVAKSVFANYSLIGTNWGGNVEPDGTQLANGSVPAFLGNTTMETYIQSDPKVGNCVGCHSFATLAYSKKTDNPKKPITYSADFSFLLGLANNQCTDVSAGPIFSNEEAKTKCPTVCAKNKTTWNGQWTTTVPGLQSVCGCCASDTSAASSKK